MAKLVELGHRYPCSSEGFMVPVDDQETMLYAGDILEVWFTADSDISSIAAAETIAEVVRMKNDYPDFVLHYVKVETRKITVQYSVAPAGASHSPPVAALIWVIVKAIGIILAVVLAAYLIYVAVNRQYLFPVKLPTGTAIITAKHTETQQVISGVGIIVDGELIGETDGGSLTVEDMGVGDHQFAGVTLEGFHPPDSITATIIKNEITNVTIWYRPSDIPPPTKGYLHVYTSPVTGVVYVDGTEKGVAPIVIELAIGNHSVGFGPIEGYITPPVQTVTIIGGATTTVTGKYTTPNGEDWWEKYLKYALIGGGVIIGTALILPPAIRALAKRSEEK